MAKVAVQEGEVWMGEGELVVEEELSRVVVAQRLLVGHLEVEGKMQRCQVEGELVVEVGQAYQEEAQTFLEVHLK